MPGGLVVHNAALERQRNEGAPPPRRAHRARPRSPRAPALTARALPPPWCAVAMHNAAIQNARANPYGSANYFKPDPNSQFMRRMKAATVERAIQESEAQRRDDCGEATKVYDRKKFIDAGFNHYDMYFTDGGNPTDAILKRFLEVCETFVITLTRTLALTLTRSP